MVPLDLCVIRLKFKVNMYKMDEERDIKPKTLSALVSNMMYEKRFGPYFVEPVIAGLTEDNKPFLSSMDCLGCEMMTKDFVVAGTMEDALYGMCESLYRPDLVRLLCWIGHCSCACADLMTWIA